jgi:hypothetical protein
MIIHLRISTEINVTYCFCKLSEHLILVSLSKSYHFMDKLKLRPELFWDIDTSKMDVEKSKRLIIDRVLSLGTLKEFQAILGVYGKGVIKKEVQKIGYFDRKTLEFIVSYFGIDKRKMKCYTKNRNWI